MRDRTLLLPLGLVLGTLVALGWSAVAPYERLTWWLEVLPVLVGLPLLVWLWRRLPLTRLVCVLLFLHALLLIVGGHYTYARVPLGEWVRDAFGLARNHYDRLGHLAQGFVPAMLVREVLLRRGVVRGRGWLAVLVTGFCLGFSAGYELVEWRVSVAGGGAADSFLGTQGDAWDTHWDMFLALLGALLAQLLLGRWHDRQLARAGVLAPAAAPTGDRQDAG